MDDLPILASGDSVDVYRTAVAGRGKDADALARLGHALLALDSLDAAERQFHRSIKYGKRPEAYYGLALCYWKQTKRQQMIMALRIEPNFKNAIKRDPKFRPAYFGLAEWYRDKGFADDVIGYLRTYMTHYPDDLDGRYLLAMAQVEKGNYGKAVWHAEKAVLEESGGNRWFPIAAQGYSAAGQDDRAIRTWLTYINHLSEDEAFVYRDLQLIATPQEMRAIARAPADSTWALLRRFWQRRDLTMVSGGKGRESEHYRRVWYALNFLSKSVKPWDLRGDIYIRYGEPDYRSRSDRTNSIPPPAAYNVKERAFVRLYQDLLEGPGIDPVFPVGTYAVGENVGWESWVYASIGSGVEFVFEDEQKNGRWRWPPIPKGWTDNVALMDRGMAFHPSALFEDVSRRAPDHFDLPPGYDPLEFYYTTATFRGADGQTDAEIYFGIPPSAKPDTSDGRLVTRIDRVAVLGTGERDIVDRIAEQLAFAEAATEQKGVFYPDRAVLSSQPGDYQLSVQVSDRSTRKRGVYLQDIELPDYSAGLSISDVAIAFKAGEMPGSERFRRGDVVVMPMPSRSFRQGQHPSFYYEVYNLQVDEFGRSRYRIEYEVRRHRVKSRTVAGFVGAGLSSLFGGKKPSFQVSYDRDGGSEWEPVYFELDTDQVEPGLNMLMVRVTDLLTNTTLEKEAVFRLDEPERRLQPEQYDPRIRRRR